MAPSVHCILGMNAAAKKHDAAYAAFAASMLAALAAEEASIAALNARMSLHTSLTADTSAATVAPRKAR
jgi:hypothetical protein